MLIKDLPLLNLGKVTWWSQWKQNRELELAETTTWTRWIRKEYNKDKNFKIIFEVWLK